MLLLPLTRPSGIGWFLLILLFFSAASTNAAFLTFVEVQRDGVGWGDSFWGAISMMVSPDGTGGEADEIVAVLSRDGSTGIIDSATDYAWWSVNLPTSRSIEAIDMLTQTDGWAVGRNGTILHYDGTTWIATPSPAATTLYSIDMLTPGDGWAVGGNGTILHYDDNIWSEIPSPIEWHLYSVDIVGSSDGWATGSGGIILHYDGSTWSEAASPTTWAIHSVDMVGSSDGWAVGSGGIILHYDGIAWSKALSLTTNCLYSVDMVTLGDGWAVGSGGIILRYDGNSWSQTSSPITSTLYSVNMMAPDDGWAVGSLGTILHYDGSAWLPISIPSTWHLKSVSALTSSDGWAAGSHGLMLHQQAVHDSFLPVVLKSGDESPPGPSPTPEPTPELPPQLAWDFYPNGLTRTDLLNRLPDAVQKTGHIEKDEAWSGTIHVTGDVQVDTGVTLTIEPGTLVLIAARSDDQHTGHSAPIDLFNPKDPPYEGEQRVEIWVDGSLIVRGTADEPVIITSDAVTPQNDDWGNFLVGSDSGESVEITRAIIEFFHSMGIGSSNVVIRQSIIRNTMTSVTIGDIKPETTPENALDVRPTLIQNYIYNGGRNMITIRAGAPTISHNVVMARPDMDTTGWEHGAIGTDFPTCAVIDHNYLDAGQPRLYEGEVFGQYHEFTQPQGFTMAGMCSFVFEYNTIIGSPLGAIGHAGPWSLEYNNIIPIPASGPPAEEPDSWNNQTTCIFAYDHRPEPSDEWQFEFLEQLGGVPLVEVFTASHNFWGTTASQEIEDCLKLGVGDSRIEYRPFETGFIAEALPNWHEFEW